MVYTLRFFLFKMQFHNSNVFGSCIIHILYTGCVKIKKKIRRQKVKRVDYLEKLYWKVALNLNLYFNSSLELLLEKFSRSDYHVGSFLRERRHAVTSSRKTDLPIHKYKTLNYTATFSKTNKIRFHGSQLNCSRVITCIQTDRQKKRNDRHSEVYGHT